MPPGVAWPAQVVPPSVVATSTPTVLPGAVDEVPTAQQSPTFGHDRADRAVIPLGELLVLQCRPPSAVASTDGPVGACGAPAAQHFAVVGRPKHPLAEFVSRLDDDFRAAGHGISRPRSHFAAAP